MSATYVFDAKLYEGLNKARAEVVSRLLKEQIPKLGLSTAADIGSGPGFFSSLLRGLGMGVVAVDGRKENVEEAKRRYPEITFRVGNVEDEELCDLGHFDLVLCFGLLYHLENPLLAIHNLRAITGSLLLVDSVIFPGDEPVMALIDEEPLQDQGLRHLAFYPTESCLIKMLFRAGYLNVFKFRQQPIHPDYHAKADSRRVRTVLAASLNRIDSPLLIEQKEPASSIRPWDPRSGFRPTALERLTRYAKKALPGK